MAKRQTNHRGVPRRDVNAALRALQAIDLIAAGSTYAEAAATCGYGSKGACHDAVQRELDRVVVAHVETLRKLALRRLQRLRKVYMPKAEAGDGWSADRIMRFDEREAALMGLDAAKHNDEDAVLPTVVREVYPSAWVDGLVALASLTPLVNEQGAS